MVNKIIDGKLIASQVRNTLAEKIKNFGITPVLKVIIVGQNDASKIYVRNKQNAAREVGIDCEILVLSDDITKDELITKIEELNNDEAVDGVIVQLPLPRHINSLDIIAKINPLKDVDGFNPYNQGLLAADVDGAFVPATPKAVLRLLESLDVNLEGKNVVIVGRSNIVGKPLSMLLLNRDCTVSVTHSKTKNLAQLTKLADIIVAACGVPKLIKSDWVKEDAIIIDVGINRADGKLCGDVDYLDVLEKVSHITPVPGGVGPMTVAMLLENTFLAACNNKG